MTIRTRRQRREMRAEIVDPPPMPRTSTKTKADFLDKTYKFFLRKYVEDHDADEDNVDRYAPPEYQLEGIPAGDIVYANSRRKTEWPSSLPESLNWLTELCNSASTYTGAWVITSTGVLNDLIEAYTKHSQAFGQTQHIGETMLIVLLVSLCLRVKETHYRLTAIYAKYLDFFIDVLRQAMINQHFVLKVNARYEFNGTAMDSLVPLIYGCYTQPYIPQFTKGEKSSTGVVHVTIDLYEPERVKAYNEYRDHVELCNKRATALWAQLGRSHEKMDEHLARALGYSPSVINLVWNTLSELFDYHKLISHITNLNPKSLSILKTSLLKSIETFAGTSPRAYMVAMQLYRIGFLDFKEISPCVPELWRAFERFLDAKIYGNDDCFPNMKLKTLSVLMLLITLPKVEPPPSVVEKFKMYCRLPISYEDNSLVNLRIWHLASRIPSQVLDVCDFDKAKEEAPKFVHLAYQILVEQSRRRTSAAQEPTTPRESEVELLDLELEEDDDDEEEDDEEEEDPEDEPM